MQQSAATNVLWAGDDLATGELDPASLSEALSGVRVTGEPDFQAARDLVTEDRVTCAVVEYVPDGFDGLAFIDAVGRSSSAVPVILVPAENDPEVARRAVQAGVTAYVPRTHPDAFDALVDAVDGVCARTAQAPTLDRLGENDLSLRKELQVVKAALDAAPIGITIAAAGESDNPLVYANPQFEAMTGYDREELLGVNCRFLQGENTDPERVAELRAGIEAEEPVTVDLRNYRKDGSEFWNRIHVKPIRNAEGAVTHYVGFQREIGPGEERNDIDSAPALMPTAERIVPGPER